MITDVDAELTSVHFPVNANKMCYNLVSMAIFLSTLSLDHLKELEMNIHLPTTVRLAAK